MFLTFSKAFNTVSHRVLKANLEKSRLGKSTIRSVGNPLDCET